MRVQPLQKRPPGQGTQIEVNQTEHFVRYKCTRCVIQYELVPNERADCPLCRQEIKTEQMRVALKSATDKLEIMEKELERLRVQVDMRTAMRDALDLINDDDRMFLKSVLYRWRKDKMIRLKVMHAEHEGERKAMGFIADTRVGEPEVYQCTSIGGLAVAALYEESLHVVGNADAMRTLLKAAQHLLPGGVE